MRPLTSLEKSLLVLSATLVLGGFGALIFPRAMGAQIQSIAKGGRPDAFVQSFSKGDCRMYGALAAVLGFSLAGLAIYPLKR